MSMVKRCESTDAQGQTERVDDDGHLESCVVVIGAGRSWSWSSHKDPLRSPRVDLVRGSIPSLTGVPFTYNTNPSEITMNL